jgi:DNA-binding transcriptional ArsR family regulator
MQHAPSGLFRALADPTRLALFERLASGGEISVKELTRSSRVSQSAVSQHLAALRDVGLIDDRRSGRCVFYRARCEALRPVIDWVTHYASFWRDRFDALERELAAIPDSAPRTRKPRRK